MRHLPLLVLLACSAPDGPAHAAPPSAEPPAAARATIDVAELLKRSPADEPVLVRGQVVRVYTCPPCPEGAQCKPCMGDNLVLSDEDKRLETWDLGPTDAIVFASAEHLAALAVGQQVTLPIVVRTAPAPNGQDFHATWDGTPAR